MAGTSSSGWNHTLEPLQPAQIAPLQRAQLANLAIPTLTVRDLRVREDVRLLGVKIEDEAVAFAMIQPSPPDGFPGPLLSALAAPGQSCSDLSFFFAEVVRAAGIRAVWVRSDDAALLELLVRDQWHLRAISSVYLLERLPDVPEIDACQFVHLEPSDANILRDFAVSCPEACGGELNTAERANLLREGVIDGLLMQGRLVGIARVIPQVHPGFVGLEVYIAEGHRKRGLGRALAARVSAQELQADRKLILTPATHDVRARRLTEATGARPAAVYLLATRPTITLPDGRSSHLSLKSTD